MVVKLFSLSPFDNAQLAIEWSSFFLSICFLTGFRDSPWIPLDDRQIIAIFPISIFILHYLLDAFESPFWKAWRLSVSDMDAFVKAMQEAMKKKEEEKKKDDKGEEKMEH